MRFLLIDSIDFPYGGAHSVHVSLLMQGFRRNDEDVYLIIPYGSKKEAIKSNKNRHGHYDGVPYFFVRRNRAIKKIFRFIDIFIGTLHTAALVIQRKKKKKLDGVILFGPDILRDSPIILACRYNKIPLFFWFVEKYSLIEDTYGIAGFLNFCSQKMSETLLPRFSSGVIVISTLLRNHYRRFLPESKILISPILVSDNMIKSVSPQLIEEKKNHLKSILQYKNLLIYSGSFGEKDGVFYLIDAFDEVLKSYPDTLFIMTGGNDKQPIVKKAKDYISVKKLQNKIYLAGFVSSDELYCYTSLADVLFACRTMSPFANHGFPWKLGEYCMTENPIIATRVGDIELYFKNNVDLFIVEPNNSLAIAEKIIYIFNNHDQAKMVAQKGKQTALNNFEYSEKSKEMMTFIKANL